MDNSSKTRCAFFFMLALFSSVGLGQTLKSLEILHTNDMHAHIFGVTPDDAMCTLANIDTDLCYGGFDRMATLVDRFRKQNNTTLLVDAGDQFQGSMFHQLYGGLASAQFMNEIGFDAMAVGNHEFDNGPEALAKFASTIRFPLLSANIDASAHPLLKDMIKPYVIVHKKGLRIGIIGYTTEDTRYLSAPGPKVHLLPIIPSVKKAVVALQKAKVDVIIALSHAGLARDKEVASKVSGIAVIVSGHTNSLLSNTVKNSDGPCPLVIRSLKGEPVLLVSAYAYGKFLGRLNFSFDESGVPKTWSGEPILLDQRVPRKRSLSLLAHKLYEPVAQLEKEQVGALPLAADGRDCRFEECIFGNFITDSMLEFAKKFGISIALMNAGGIRASLPQGAVNRAHIKDVLPFEKKVVFVKLKGREIQKNLEHGVSFVEDRSNDNTGRFLQVSGLKYSFDPRKPRGERVSHILVYDPSLSSFMPLDSNKIYGIAINSYIAQGGDNYSFLSQSHERWSIDIDLKDLLDTFIKSPKSQLPKLEGRIVNLARASQLRLPQTGPIVR